MIQFILPNILGSNVFQLQTSLTTHFIVQIELFAIFYKVYSSVNVSGVFGLLTIIDLHTSDLISKLMQGACSGTTSESLIINLLFIIMKFDRAIPEAHAALY